MTLLDLLQLLKQRLALVIALPIVLGLLTAGVSWGLLSNEYTANVSMYVLAKTQSADKLSSSDLSASQSIANDIAVLVDTDRVKNAAAKSLGLYNLDDYKVKVDSKTTNRVITLSITGKDPSKTAQVADEMAKQVSKVAVEVMNLEAVNVVDNAQVPTSPSGPKRLLYVLVAFAAGLFAAIAIVVLLDTLDMTIKSAEEAEKLLDLPVLGKMPKVKM